MNGEHEQDAGHSGGRHQDHEHLRHVPGGARPAVFAARAALVFDPPAHADFLEDALTGFLAGLSEGLAAGGCTLVGHIKGVVSAGGNGDLAFHATTLSARPVITGGVAGTVAEAALTVNVIVFGVDEATLPAIVRDAWSRAGSVKPSGRLCFPT